MIAVIFEALPHAGKEQDYFELASQLYGELENVKGFISVERFQSVNAPEKYLSLSFWENQEAVSEWRKNQQHRLVQKKGRSEIFDNYRIRVADVVRDYEMFNRESAPDDSDLD